MLNGLKPKDIVQLSSTALIKEQAFELDQNFMFGLTKENAEKALWCIKSDPKYKESSYVTYYNALGKSLCDYSQAELNTIIEKIARSNSTRTSKKNIASITDYIFRDFSNFLARLDNGDISLVAELSTCGNTLDRNEKSLASKICAYLCELEFDKYSYIINDNIVRSVLPYYLNYYSVDENLWKKGNKVKELDKLSYKEIHNLISEIKNKLSDNLSYREIDNIIWYCYRNDPVRVAIAKELAKIQ